MPELITSIITAGAGRNARLLFQIYSSVAGSLYRNTGSYHCYNLAHSFKARSKFERL